jgi:hypothetical protein
VTRMEDGSMIEVGTIGREGTFRSSWAPTPRRMTAFVRSMVAHRAGLEATACECYKVAHEQFNSLWQLRTTSAIALGGRASIVASAP